MKEAPRVLFVDQYPTLGGGQRILLGLVQRAVERGWTVGVALPAGGEVEARASACGAAVFGIGVPALTKGTKLPGDVVTYAGGVVSGTRQLAQVVRSFDPDIIHVNGGRVLLQALAARSGRPIVFHLHSSYDDAATRLIVRGALSSPAVKLAVAPSRFMADWAERRLGLSQRRIRIVHNWADDGFFGVHHRDLTPAWGWPPGKTVVGVSGRVTQQKGQALAVQAARMLREAGADVGLVVVGPVDTAAGGEAYWREVTREAASLGSDFLYLGATADVPAVLACLSIALVPSAFEESFGLTAAEAMAAGIPTVVSPRGALPEVVGRAGLVAKECAARCFAEEIAKLIGDSGLHRRMSGDGRERARRRFAQARQTDAALDVLEEVARGYK